MSRHKAAEFFARVGNDARLRKQLSTASNVPDAWIELAASTGYEFDVDELRSAIEEIVGEPLSSDELVETLRSLVENELDDTSLDAVSGGLANTINKAYSRRNGAS